MIRILEEYADFTALWEYQGDIFRVIDKSIVYPKEGEPYSRMPKICWHGMVASWSSSFDFTVGFNHMLPESKYTIIHANTGESAGIDTNKLGEHLGYYVSYTESENEIIFPMKKEFVIEVYEDITLTEFKVRMEERLKND